MAEGLEIKEGLQGVYITKSEICKVDGQEGKLYYRGYKIEDLANYSSYEEVCYLLLYGKLPNSKELADFIKKMKEERSISENTKEIIRRFSKESQTLDVLRTAMSSLSADDSKPYSDNENENIEKAIKIIAKTATIAAAIGRIKEGKEILEPDNDLNHSANFLYMLTGEKPNKDFEKLMDVMFILHAEHSSNASTFATLVACSTLADIYAGVTAGVAALKGPLHGGADEAAIKMMKEIGNPNNTENYIEEALAGKRKIMGFGHRVYKTYDPRARILKSYLDKIKGNSNEEINSLIEISLRAEKMMIERLGKSHGIWPNVDFFSGPLYMHLNIKPELFDTVFASSRTVGWCSHVIEYWRNNKLFRPLEEYIGKIDLEYLPIDKR
ncbi:MAG: citrate synthase/methylcitrate synthase [Candidatus Parvarchaeota archaeon]|nr:citrate synthase/methylcitrate synthase [Candidatus Parvarchaeota archaeon]MCW1295862.1 citrate synthase/methylcitrate synthase [Candidatus Parvarchaeum tengchongense]MCW1298944.1 citrate synthase/methylcitrate synthase [Candidatus Parvarchaeum tengchongense]MCW1312014.1 citrate synthase/methylcitrate synthase [Candidatus Parvarchaeum tengchongense]